VKVANADLILAVVLALTALTMGYVFDYQSSKGGNK
jgi:hypothetical protein